MARTLEGVDGGKVKGAESDLHPSRLLATARASSKGDSRPDSQIAFAKADTCSVHFRVETTIRRIGVLAIDLP